jgi:hypothetical protein
MGGFRRGCSLPTDCPADGRSQLPGDSSCSKAGQQGSIGKPLDLTGEIECAAKRTKREDMSLVQSGPPCACRERPRGLSVSLVRRP